MSKQVLAGLKVTADKYGIKYSPNIGAPALMKKINEYEETLKNKDVEVVDEVDESTLDELADTVDETVLNKTPPSTAKPKVNEEFEKKAARAARIMANGHGKKILDSTKTPQELKMEAIKMSRKKIRVRVTVLDPSKKDLPGAVYGVRNCQTPLAKHFVPFDGSVVHLPQMLVNHLKEKDCQVFKSVPSSIPGADPIRKSVKQRMFSVEILPDLTQEELENLKDAQTARNNLD